MSSRTTSRYGIPLITLHWFMLALIVAVYACIELREFYPEGSTIRGALKTWHYLLGLTVFALVWLRLFARLAGRVPPIVPSPPQWQLRVAHAVEFAIYHVRNRHARARLAGRECRGQDHFALRSRASALD